MTFVLKKCIECGCWFMTLFDSRCDQCQSKTNKIYSDNYYKKRLKELEASL